jgi:nucleoside-diphosphate-sugar epimerase
VLQAVQPDWLVMAAIPPGHAVTRDARRGLLLGICNGLLGVLEAAHAVGFSGALTWLGSSMAYGRGGAPRQTHAPLRPQTFRGAVKAAESLLAGQLATQSGIALTEIRVFCGYGPYEQRDRFFPCLLRAALSGERVRLTAVPGRRDWIHYDDIARACLASAALPHADARVFNACSGRVQDTHAAAALLEAITGKPLIADTPYEADDRYGDVEPGVLPSLADGLDWSPQVSLAEGLEQCWHWARSPEGRAYLLDTQLLDTQLLDAQLPGMGVNA